MTGLPPDTKRWHICRPVVPQKVQSAPGDFTLEGLLERLKKLSLREGPLIDFDRIGFRAVIAGAGTPSRAEAEGTDWFTPPDRVVEKGDYQIEEPPGDWYVRLLASVDAIVRVADEHDAAVLSLPLQPPGGYRWRFDPKEPFLQALQIATASGVIVIVAAGNDGDKGHRTMNPWSRPSWVVSVGACDRALTAVEPWSSRGDPADLDHRPFVLAEGFNRDGEPGTSFAVPRVARVTRWLCELLVTLGRALAIPPAVYRPNLLPTVKHVLRSLALPITGPVHQVGHGAVSQEGPAKWLAESTRDELKAILPMLGLTGDPQMNAAVQEMLNPAKTDPEPPSIAQIVLDRGGYAWSRPAHAAGVIPLRRGSGRIFLTSAKPRLGNLFDVAAWELLPGNAAFQFAMDPMMRRGQILQVGPGQPFQTIGAALEVARRFDFVHVFPGTYVESVRVPSGVHILADRGVVLTHPENVPLILEGAKDVAISGLRVMSAAPRRSPVTLIKGNNVEFKDCELIGLKANGIEIHRGIRVSFSRCIVSGGIVGAGVFVSYSIKFLGCRISGEETGILGFHSALRLEDSEIRAAKGFALVLMPPFQIWPEILENTKSNGDLNIEWVDFLAPFAVNLNQIFAQDQVPPGIHGELMAEIRSTLAKQTSFEGKGYSIVSSVPGLVTLQSCVQIPSKTGRMVSMNRPLPRLDLEHVSYKDSHAVAQVYLSLVEIQEMKPEGKHRG